MEYNIWDKNVLNDKREVILNFFMNDSNQVRFTWIEWSSLWFFYFKRYWWEKDEKFKTVLVNLEKYFIKKETNNLLYNDSPQLSNLLFSHYYYRLSQEIKDKFLGDEYLFKSANLDDYFYCFEDPVFYMDDKIIGWVITHENMVFLYLDEQEKKDLLKQWVVFE
jgi:hypothetical protein